MTRRELFKQNYTEIREQCLSQGVLFEDPYFRAVDFSLFYQNPPNETIHWKRPHEICQSAPVWFDNVDVVRRRRFDVVQGHLGDCWLLAAVASLTCNQRLFERVVPPDQSFQDGYCGVFRFRLWYQGEWVDVVVDDRLPTLHPKNPKLFYMHSENGIEFWSALLEKAYAKLYGCYECLQGGSALESLEDLTGGIAETFSFAETPDSINLKEVMVKTLERGGLITCSMTTKRPEHCECPQNSIISVRRSDEGILYNHAYSVTSVREVKLTDGTSEFLVRVRNPWGGNQKWRGDWSDNSAKWELVSPQLMREMSVTFEEDGEFWMSFADFFSHFTTIDLCNLDPLYIEDGIVDGYQKWDVVSYHDAWIKYFNAGGCLNYKDSMWKNPQFRVSLTKPDEQGGNECTMIVALFQKDRRRRFREGLEFLKIGYVIYKPSPGYQKRPLNETYFRHNPPVESGKFVNYREVCGRHKLPIGDYVIIPSTYEPEQDARFLLRIFTEKDKTSSKINEETLFWRDTLDGPDFVDGEGNEEFGRLTSQLKKTDEIDAYQLMDILKSHLSTGFPFSGFHIDACRSMVAVNDNEMTGRLDYAGYEALCRDLLEWKAAFETTDSEKKGRVSSYSLRSTLHSLGYSVSNDTLQAMVLRYVNKDGDIEFPDFILSLVKLKTLIDTSKKFDLKNTDTFVKAGLYS